MRMEFILLTIAAFYTFHPINAQAQTIYERQDAAGKIIDVELKSLFGEAYSAPYVYEVDSLLGPNNHYFFSNPLEDPYGTLKNCFIFIGGPERFHGNIVGVHKNGHVIWHSDPINCYSHLQLFTTQDLNNDGTVDLVFKAGGEETQLWIFSWDGLMGRRINAITEDGASVIEGSDLKGTGSFSFLDIEGDGVWEIKNFHDEDGSGGWSWNGQEYGHWVNTPNMNIMFPPRNKIDLSVTCRVSKQADTLQFNYEVFNKTTSKQRVDDIRVLYQPPKAGVYVYAPPFWTGGGYFTSGDYIWWGTTTDYHTGNIGVGKNMSGFIVKAKSLCTISPFNSHGYNAIGSLKRSDFVEKSYLITKDKLENAFWGTTIGPVDPPDSLVPINIIDTLTSFTTRSRDLGWISTQQTAAKYLAFFTSAKTALQANNVISARSALNSVLTAVNQDSSTTLTSEAYALLRYNTEYLLSKLPLPPSGTVVKLINSGGSRLTTGTLQYYEGAWKDAVNNNDGTFTINTTAKSLSLRMTYEYGSQTKSNVPVGSDTIVFQTVNAQVKLVNSQGTPIDTGTVQYYAGAWRNLGSTTNGIASKELLPGTYSFRMTYAYTSKDKQQDIGANPTVVFQTVNAAIQLKNSQGNPIDTGIVQYYSGAWRNFGVTSGGTTYKELLPNNYSFRMTYAFTSKDIQQDIGVNRTVIFQTVNAAVQLKNSQGNLIDVGTVQYYSGAWREFGTTTNGVVNKELLPNNYSFRMLYAFASKDKQQDIGTNPTVVFQTVIANVQLQNSQGALMDQSAGGGTVQYYSGAWRSFGTSVNGMVAKELLPNNYSFRMTYEYVSNDKSQDLSTNSTVNFSTVRCTIRVKNSQNQPVDNALASYYSGAWRQIGNTVNGEVTKELLPVNLTFRAKLGTVQQDKAQNLSTSNVVEFSWP